MSEEDGAGEAHASVRQSPGRRVMDIIVAATGLVLTCWLAAMAAIAVRLSSPGPVLYRATRAARGGGTFTLYKFRSMVLDTKGTGPAVTAGADSRITRVGAVLRATKLDEWPQLWNVLRGDMSLVGPRPEDPRYVAEYTASERKIMDARPGITSPASIQYRYESEYLQSLIDDGKGLEEAYAEILASKLRIDLAYLETRTPRTDITVLVDTLRAVFRRP